MNESERLNVIRRILEAASETCILKSQGEVADNYYLGAGIYAQFGSILIAAAQKGDDQYLTSQLKLVELELEGAKEDEKRAE